MILLKLFVMLYNFLKCNEFFIHLGNDNFMYLCIFETLTRTDKKLEGSFNDQMHEIYLTDMWYIKKLWKRLQSTQ